MVIVSTTVLTLIRYTLSSCRSYSDCPIGYKSIVLHQSYFLQFVVSKKMNEAAVLIQSKFRSYQEQKRFQRSRHAAILIQSFYRNYKHGQNFTSTKKRKEAVKIIDALR